MSLVDRIKGITRLDIPHDPLSDLRQEDTFYGSSGVQPPRMNAAQRWSDQVINRGMDNISVLQRSGILSQPSKQLSPTKTFYALTGGRVDATAPLSPRSQLGSPWGGSSIPFKGSPSNWSVDVQNYVPGQGLKFSSPPPEPQQLTPGSVRIGRAGAMTTDAGINPETGMAGITRSLVSPYGSGESYQPIPTSRISTPPRLLRGPRLLEDMQNA